MMTLIRSLDSDASFSQPEAQELVSLFNSITRKTQREIHEITSRLTFVKKESSEYKELKRSHHLLVTRWSDKIRRLGGVPLAPFKVELNSSRGRFIWEYPRADLDHYLN